MSNGVKALIAVVVIGGLLYWYYVSSAPVAVAANAPNGAGSQPTSGGGNVTTQGLPVSGTGGAGGYNGTGLSPTVATGGANTTLAPNSVGTLFGITPPTPKASTTTFPGVSTYISNLIKRVPSLAGTDALSVNPTTGYVSPTSTAAAAALRGKTGAGAAGTSSTGYVAPSGQASPTTIANAKTLFNQSSGSLGIKI